MEEQEYRWGLETRISKGKEASRLLGETLLQEYFKTMEEVLSQKVWNTPLDDKEQFTKMILDVKEQIEGVKMFRQFLEGLEEDGKMAQFELNKLT
jgi:hypothetical protein